MTVTIETPQPELPPPPSRRDLFLGAAAVGALALATPYLARVMVAGADDLVPHIDAISEIVIPGSSTTRPGQFIASVLPHEWIGLTIGHVRHVNGWLARNAGGDFLGIGFARRYAAIDALDRGAFEAKLDETTFDAWTAMKRALMTAYYTTEKGGARDLRFELVPGRWDPDIPLAQEPHPLSNDWLAIWFS